MGDFFSVEVIVSKRLLMTLQGNVVMGTAVNLHPSGHTAGIFHGLGKHFSFRQQIKQL